MPTSNLETQQESSVSVQAIEEIGLTIAAKDLTPTMVSQDFLKFSGIIPKDWELSQQPVLNPAVAQLNFKNGVNINAQSNSINITESISQKNLEDITVAQIATKYVAQLPYAEYIGYGFNAKMLLPFPNNPEQVRNYITGNLLAPGPWKQIGKAPVQAGINLMYILEQCQLSISVAEARLQQPQQPPMTAILFSGSFNYGLSNINDAQEKLTKLNQAISSWQRDFGMFREIVTQKFLGSPSAKETKKDEATLFPMGDIL